MTSFSFALRPVAGAAACAFAALSSVTLAQSVSDDAPSDMPMLDPVVVTATRTPMRVNALLSDVQVIDNAALERSTGRTLGEVLAREAGIQVAASGGRGSGTSVFTRGTESRHTLLLIDGMRYGSATLGTPAWENIPLSAIERIEIVKGPASALYGSEAVGGVVQVFTKKGKAGYHPYASIRAGSYGHRALNAGTQGASGSLRYALDASHTKEGGFSATNPRVGSDYQADKDGFRQESINASLGFDISPDWTLDAKVLHSKGQARYDDSGTADTHARMRTQALQLRAKGQATANWQTDFGFGRTVDDADALKAAWGDSSYRTTQDQWSWNNSLSTAVGTVTAGLEHTRQKVDSSTAYAVQSRTINSLYAGLQGEAGRHRWQLNLRRDRNSQFGSSSTYLAAYGAQLSPAWRVRAAHGTSFVAPSFNQLYWPQFGNTQLQPERGRNTELGLAYASGGQEVELTRFDNRIRDFIDGSKTSTNVQRVRIDGWTLAYNARVQNWRFGLATDSLNPRNAQTGAQLLRRAKTQTRLNADYAQGAWGLGGSLLHMGSRPDQYYDANFNAIKTTLPAYTTVDVYARYQLTPTWQVQLKLNNLSNTRYETVYGYNQPGRAAYVTLSWQPRS